MVGLKKHIPKTIEDLLALPDDVKAELIDGEIYMMAPAAARHSLINRILTVAISNYLESKRKKAPDGVDGDFWLILPEAWTYYDDINTFVHDIAAYLESELPQVPKTGPIKVKPQWVCEILSPSNWSNDTKRKRVVLQEHRVPYYWLVDPERKSVHVYEMSKTGDRYEFAQSVEASEGVVKLSPFVDLELDLVEIFKH
jgi:Uma2 family endonuclease